MMYNHTALFLKRGRSHREEGEEEGRKMKKETVTSKGEETLGGEMRIDQRQILVPERKKLEATSLSPRRAGRAEQRKMEYRGKTDLYKAPVQLSHHRTPHAFQVSSHNHSLRRPKCCIWLWSHPRAREETPWAQTGDYATWSDRRARLNRPLILRAVNRSLHTRVRAGQPAA